MSEGSMKLHALQGEKLLSVKQALAHPLMRDANGRKRSRYAVYRAMEIGRINAAGQRVRLESVLLPTGRITSEEALKRFVAKLNAEPVTCGTAGAA